MASRWWSSETGGQKNFSDVRANAVLPVLTPHHGHDNPFDQRLPEFNFSFAAEALRTIRIPWSNILSASPTLLLMRSKWISLISSLANFSDASVSLKISFWAAIRTRSNVSVTSARFSTGIRSSFDLEGLDVVCDVLFLFLSCHR
jgi:hypothetical protein